MMKSIEAVSEKEPALAEAARVTYSLQAIHAHVGGELVGDSRLVIVGVNSLDMAGLGELAFAESKKYIAHVRRSRAAAFIVPLDFPVLEDRVLLKVTDPRLAFFKVMRMFQPPSAEPAGVDRNAVVASDVQLGEDVTIRACAVVRSKARIGRRTVIESGAFIAEEVFIGESCFIGPNVVIMRGCRIGNRVIIHGGTVIGADGFGFVWTDGCYMKIPQLGNVVIEDDVELGANVCIDRATLGSTLIKRGTKIDNLVQIAHNDIIGEDVTISGQVGLAGSVKVGNRVIIGGQAGAADHVTIGDDAKIGGGSGVTRNVPAGQTVWWFPAREIKKVKEELAALALLPKWLKQLSRSKSRTKRTSRK